MRKTKQYRGLFEDAQLKRFSDIKGRFRLPDWLPDADEMEFHGPWPQAPLPVRRQLDDRGEFLLPTTVINVRDGWVWWDDSQQVL